MARTPAPATTGSPTEGPVGASGRRAERERGQALVMFALVLVVIMGAASLVLDVGVLRNANQTLWNALDAGWTNKTVAATGGK